MDIYGTNANCDNSTQIVYIDESYIHKNYHRHDDSLFGPNNEQDLERIVQHKGKHYWFIAAIINDNQSPDVLALPYKDQPDECRAGLIHKTLDIFEGGKKQSVDYHGMFDSAYFIWWMDKLIEALAAWNVQHSLCDGQCKISHKSAWRYAKRILEEREDGGILQWPQYCCKSYRFEKHFLIYIEKICWWMC